MSGGENVRSDPTSAIGRTIRVHSQGRALSGAGNLSSVRKVPLGERLLAGARFFRYLPKLRTLRIEEARTVFGAGFVPNSFNHLIQTLQEYDRRPSIHFADTSLYKYLKQFTPTSLADWALPVGAECGIQLFEFPWGSLYAPGRRPDLWATRKCGPSTDEFIQAEFTRFIALRSEIEACGYRPLCKRGGFIEGVWLHALNGQRRFIVLQGNHRLAILAHLGVGKLVVRNIGGLIRSPIHEAEAVRWQRVTEGLCTQHEAVAVFRLFFDQEGEQIYRFLARQNANRSSGSSKHR